MAVEPETSPNVAAMRVLHVNTARDFRGGERQTLFLAVGQWRLGMEVRVVAPPGSALLGALAGEGFPAERMHPVRMRGELHPGAIVRLGLLLRRHRPDILHLHTAHAHALGMLAALLYRPVRTVVARRVDYPMARGALSRLKYRHVDGYVAISEAVRRILVADGIPPGRVHLVRSGIRPPDDDELASLRARRGALRRERGLPEGGHVVLNVGNLVGHKGQEILPRAARILPPEVTVLIAGDGPERSGLVAAIAREGVADRVRLLGQRTDLPELYALADVYVQPSTSEGLGTAMLDAMAWALPVVATMAGGIPEAVRDGENGILLAGRNPYLLGEAIKKLCGEEELSVRLGRRGREIARTEFSDERMVRGTLAAYEEVKACRENG